MQVTFMQVTVIDIWENWDLISGLSELRKFEAGRTGFNKVDSTYTEGWKMKLELIEITNGRKGTPIDVAKSEVKGASQIFYTAKIVPKKVWLLR